MMVYGAPPGWFGVQTPRVLCHPPYTVSMGPEALEMAATCGVLCDPWQRAGVDIMLGLHTDRMVRRFACAEFGISLARQNGKGALFEVRALAGLFILGEKKIMWSAHEYKTASEAFTRMQGLLETNPDFDRQIFKINNSHGQEGIVLHGEGGSRRVSDRRELRFVARSERSGRGFVAETNMLDEIFALTDAQNAALSPTGITKSTVGQTIYASTPPLSADTGVVMYRLRDRAEQTGAFEGAGPDPNLGWMDFGQLPHVDKKDPWIWAGANPAAGIRIAFSGLEGALLKMGPEKFGVEHLAIWPSRDIDRLIPATWWERCKDESSEIPHNDFFVAIDVTPKQDRACLTVFGLRADGLGHIEVIEDREGTEWVVPRCVEINKAHAPLGFVLDEAGPVGALLPDLTKDGTGIKRFRGEIKEDDRSTWPHRGSVFVPTAREYAGACARMTNAIRDNEIRQIDQRELNGAVAGAATRPLGDQWAFARRLAEANISPLVGGTVARWAHEKYASFVRSRTNAWSGVF